MSLRIEKINHEIRRQLTKIVQEEVDDPALGMLTITRVDTTSDLKEARIYFSLLDEKNYKRCKKALKDMKGFIKGNLANKVKLKKMPELFFFPDKSIKYSVDIGKKLEGLTNEED